MAATHGRKTRLIVGAYDLSRFFRTVDLSGDAELIDTTTFQAVAKTYIIGFKDGKLTAEGIWDASAEEVLPADRIAVDDILEPILGNTTDEMILVGQNDLLTTGAVGSILEGKEIKYSVVSPFNGVVSVMTEMQSSDGIRSCVSYQNMTLDTVYGS